MPYSTTDLMVAISDGNLNRVQEILIDRDHQGIPRIDINNDFGNSATALIWALWCDPINELIVQTLLDVRDHAHNPVSNINHKGPHGRTVLSCILSRQIDPHLRGRLLQRVLNVRGANGELITDVTADECNIPLLKQAQALNDIHCFRILQDTRTATGAFALDINEIRHGTTVLDEAEKDGIYYIRDQTMIETIQQLGGLKAIDVPEQAREEQERRRQQQRLQQIVARQEHTAHEQLPHGNPLQGQQHNTPHQDVQRFITDIQNTHQTEVTVSIAASIKNLKIRYPGIDISKTLQDIRKFLTQLPSSNTKKEYAINCLNRIERDPTEHSFSYGTQLSQSLALIWKGVHDKFALVEDLEELTEQDIECRKSTLVDNLFRAQTAYGNGGGGGAACFVGTLNKIIETLDRAHPDVTIITGAVSVLSIAAERARIIVRDELNKKPLREQRNILKSWDDPDPNNGKTIATTFREVMVNIANTQLEEEFQHLLLKEKREEITAQFEYLPRPILHKKLDELIKTINELREQDNQSRYAAIARLKEQANHAYDERDRTLQEEYELLLNAYNNFIQLDRLIKTINELDEQDNQSRRAAIARLKEQASHTYEESDRTSQEKYDLLLNAYNSFMQLDKLIKTINELPDQDNQSRQAVLVDLKKQANHAYEDNSKTFSEIKISLRNLLETMVDKILNEFEEKINTSIGTYHIEAKLEAEKLLNTLKIYKRNAFEKLSGKSLKFFAQQSIAAIKDATPVLQRDLGWGDYLANLTKQLVTTIITTIAFVATLGAYNTHHGFFALKPSDASNKSQKLEEVLRIFL